MPREYALRRIPDETYRWIESKSKASHVSVNQFLLDTVEVVREGSGQLPLFEDRPYLVASDSSMVPFKFIDLFAGIGGFRLALQRLGGTCVFTSEWDKFSQKTYEAWWGDRPQGDINEIDADEIPDHDILAAGFPCQPFSIAGVSKKNSLGKAHGFDCKEQGNLFFRICEIVKAKRPPILILENVKNLKSHDKRRTWPVIKSSLESLDYVVFDQTIDARDYVPQHRERIFIVCFDSKVFGANPGYQFPDPPSGPSPKFRDILEADPDPKYILTTHLWKYLQAYAAKHKKAGNGFGYGMTDLDGVSRTLSARYYKDGSEVLIPRGGRKRPRRLTLVEAARLMGFGDMVTAREDIPVSDTQAYKQFGNAVVPAVAEAVGRSALSHAVKLLAIGDGGCLLKTPM